jgi:hypothetical protein
MSNFIKSSIHARYFLLLGCSFLLSSCSIYKAQFDCPPPAGIPCASVTDIESMIVETEKGPDLIVTPETKGDNHCFWCGHKKAGSNAIAKMPVSARKVWICGEQNECNEGSSNKGYYLKQSKPGAPAGECVLEAEDVFLFKGKN